MGTQISEILDKNKNRSKRDLSSATFSLTMELPGSNSLADGASVIGKIEGNIAITRVALVVRDGFDGTAPTVALTDNDAVDWQAATTIASPVVLESAITAASGTPPAPIFKSTVTTFTATVLSGASTKGELAFIIDYVQLDTVVGKHTV